MIQRRQERYGHSCPIQTILTTPARVGRPNPSSFESQGSGMCVKKSWGVTHTNKGPILE